MILPSTHWPTQSRIRCHRVENPGTTPDKKQTQSTTYIWNKCLLTTEAPGPVSRAKFCAPEANIFLRSMHTLFGGSNNWFGQWRVATRAIDRVTSPCEGRPENDEYCTKSNAPCCCYTSSPPGVSCKIPFSPAKIRIFSSSCTRQRKHRCTAIVDV